MPATISHALSATTPDVTSYEIRPSHWNSGHLMTMSAVGSEISGAFGNGGGITFGYDGTNITAAAPAGAPSPINFSAGTTSSNIGSVVFSNSGGVSFGLNGSTITATVKTDYLTTAMQSNRGSDFVQATAAFAGTNASGTIASNGISVSVGNYITTADLSQNSSKYVQNWKLTGNTSGTTSSAQGTDLWLAGGNGVTISGSSNTLSFSVATNYQSQGAYLTTARASTDAVGLNTAKSNVTWTVNSSGISLDARGYAGTGTTFGGTNVSGSITMDSNGLQLSLSAGAGGGAITVSDTATSQTVGRLAFTGSNGITMGLISSNNGQATVTASYTVPTQSNQTVGFYASSNTTSSVSSGTFDARSMTMVGMGIASVGYSNGSVIVSVPSGGGAGNLTLYGTGNTTQNSSTTGINSSSLLFNGLGALSVGFSNGSIELSAPATSSIVGSNGISISSNGSTISVQGMFVDRFVPWDYTPAVSVSSTGGIGTLHLFPFLVNTNLTFNQINMIGSASQATTAVPNTYSATGSANSSIGHSYTASHSNSRFFDLFLFSRGTGGFSTEMQTFASTRVSMITVGTLTNNYTHSVGATSGTATIKQSYSYIVSVPTMTSGTMTSVNAASTVTTWQPGYSSITGSTTASTTSSQTNGSLSISLAGAYPGTTGFVSNKMVAFPFASSLPAGQYWLGMVQSTGNSSSSSGSFSNTAAANSLNTTINASVLTTMGSYSSNGMTSTIASSLGWIGNASQATMAWAPGHGSFSATWASNTTYNNNAGNPAGAVGFSQINSGVSFWRPWIEFASNRI